MGRRVRPAPQRPRIAPHAPHARTRRAPAPASRTWGASRACRRRCRSCSKRRRAGTLPPSRRPTWRASWVEAATAASRWTWANSICRCRGCRLRWRCEQRAALGHGPTRGPIRRMRACAIQRARIALARAGAETQTQRLGHGRQKQGRATAVVRRKSVRRGSKAPCPPGPLHERAARGATTGGRGRARCSRQSASVALAAGFSRPGCGLDGAGDAAAAAQGAARAAVVAAPRWPHLVARNRLILSTLTLCSRPHRR